MLFLLAYWQYQRGLYKQQLEQRFVRDAVQPPLDLQQWQQQPESYRSVALEGHWLRDFPLLLDNRTWQHRVGYQLLLPFKPLSGEALVLVNLGWLAAPAQRSQLPDASALALPPTPFGRMRSMAEQGWLLGRALPDRVQWPLRIQALDSVALEAVLQQPVLDHVLLLDPVAHGGGPRDWPVVTLPARRHFAYALQWLLLGLAALLVAGVLVLGRHPHRHRKETL